METAICSESEGKQVLGELCALPAEMLDEHSKHEEMVLRPYRGQLYQLTRYWLGLSRGHERVALRDLSVLLLSALDVSMDEIATRASVLIQRLKARMAEEDGDMFPVVYRPPVNVRRRYWRQRPPVRSTGR